MSSRTNMNGEQHTTHIHISSSSSSSSTTSTIHHHPNNHHFNNNHRSNSNNYYPNNYNSYSGHGGSGGGSSSSASFKGCCCCLFLLLTFLGLLVLAVVLVILLAVKPKKPQFELQQVGVQFVGITAAPPTGTAAGGAFITPSASLSLSIKMVFTAVNPNKVGIKYSSMTFDVMYKGVPLGRASVPGFYQPAHSIRQVETTVGVDRVNLLQDVATELVKDASLYDRVELRITGDVGAKIRVLQFTSPRVQVSLDCAIVISPKKQSLTYKQCGVDGVAV